MNIELFRNLRFEYSCGANVMMFSLIDTSTDKSVLKTTNVTKIVLEYSYNDEHYTYEKNLSFHINSILMFLTELPADTDIIITPYLVYVEEDEIQYKIQITNQIIEHTLPYGNITYNLIESGDSEKDDSVISAIENVLSYINELGTYVDESYTGKYSSDLEHSKVIPIKWEDVQTASAMYYRAYTRLNDITYYGLVRTSGGSYALNDVIFHELRHRYGIYPVSYCHIYRDTSEGKSDLFSYIHDDFIILHNAVKFETGREDAKIWIFDAHSNIPEGNYTNNEELNYLAANYIKALVWYTCHDVFEQDQSKIRIIVPVALKLIINNTSDYTSDDIDIETSEDISDDIETSDDNVITNTNKFYLSTIIRPYLVDGKTKVYLTNDNYNYNNNFINTSLNITLYPYKDITNNIYVVNNDIQPTSVVINDNFYFRLSSRLGFDGGTISLINEFLYPLKVIRKDNEYIENYDEKQITKFYNKFFIEENKEYYEREDILEDIDFPEIRTTGYVIQIATDIDFHEIVYESKINTDNSLDNFIYDFSFSLNSLFESWNQLNDILVVRAEFIDKKLNNLIRGNPVVITKKWFKYLINDSSVNVVFYQNQNNLKRINFMDINKGFNLIDKIECTVVDKDSTDISFNKESTITTKILYKPIFYKVQDLQNIKLRRGVKQNIGINLGNFLTKVDLFILNIDEMNIKESSRNNMYVIFSIDSNKLNEDIGKYNILNQDFEYISSGNYMIY